MATIKNAQQPQLGPIAQQLTKLQSNGHQAATPQLNSQQTPIKKDKWGFSNKTVWEWLLLIGTLLAAIGAIAIPIVIAIETTKSSEQQHQTDIQIALDQQRETILRTYIDDIQYLLLNRNLLTSKPTDDVSILARSRTLTALQGLDSDRKGILVQFLYEAHLIGFLDNQLKLHAPVITLNNANLFGAYMGGDYLRGVNFKGAILQESDLDHADLSYANLGCVLLGVPIDSNGGIAQCTLLNDANLSFTNLDHSDLGGAVFTHTNLKYADLSNANLNVSDTLFPFPVLNLTQQQLDQVVSCKRATLPKGLICHKKL